MNRPAAPNGPAAEQVPAEATAHLSALRGLYLCAATAALILVVLLVYGRSAYFDFVDWDDILHVYGNPHFRSFDLSGIPFFWEHSYCQLYIPVSYTVFAILNVIAYRPHDYQRYTSTGALLNPHVFHVANLILHTINVLLVFLLLRRGTRKDIPSFLGALIFALHPLQVESVAWVSELRGLLAAALCLASLHLYLSFVELSGKKFWLSSLYYSVSFLLAVCSMLAKPSSAVIGIFIAAVGIWMGGRPLRKALLESTPFAAAGFVLVAITSHDQPPVVGNHIALWLRPLIAGDTLTFYLWKFVLPLGLTMDYGRTPTYVLSHWWGCVDWLIPFLILGALYAVKTRAPYLIFGSVFALAGVLPVLGLVPFVYQHISTTADRYAYLPLTGAAIVAAYSISALRTGQRRIAVAAVSFWLAALGFLSYKQTSVWQNSTTLYSHAASVYPNAPTVQAGLADALMAQGEYQQAKCHYSRAVTVDPDVAAFSISFGECLCKLGENGEAEVEFQRAIALQKNNADAHCYLGELLLRENRPDTGVPELTTSLRLDPTEYLAAEQLGTYYAEHGKLVSAISVFQNGVNNAPGVAALWHDLSLALYSANDTYDAARAAAIEQKIDSSQQATAPASPGT